MRSSHSPAQTDRSPDIPAGSACHAEACPISHVLAMVEGKWSILILRELFRGEQRTSDFLRALPGISTKTLTQRLRHLEQHGLVERQVYAEVPPRVEYRLSQRGQELQPILQAMYQLGLRWMAEGEGCDCPIQTQHF